MNIFGSSIKWGAASVVTGFLMLLSVCVYIWQLIESGDPAEAGTRTAAIFAGVMAAIFVALRGGQAVAKILRGDTEV